MGVIIKGKGNGQIQFSLLLFVCHFLSFPFPFFILGFTQNWATLIPYPPQHFSIPIPHSNPTSPSSHPRLPPSFYFSGHFIHLPPLECFVRLPTSAASSSSQTHDLIGLLCSTSSPSIDCCFNSTAVIG